MSDDALLQQATALAESLARQWPERDPLTCSFRDLSQALHKIEGLDKSTEPLDPEFLETVQRHWYELFQRGAPSMQG